MNFYDESGKVHKEDLKFKVPSRKVRSELNKIAFKANDLIDERNKKVNQIILANKDEYTKQYRYSDEETFEGDTRTVLERESAEAVLVATEYFEKSKVEREEFSDFVERIRFEEKIQTFIAIVKVDEIKDAYVKELFNEPPSEKIEIIRNSEGLEIDTTVRLPGGDWDMQDMEEIDVCLTKFRKRIS